MAFVDFSNAQLHLPSDSSQNVTNINYVTLPSANIRNSSGQIIVTNSSCTALKDDQKQLLYVYTGTFTDSGTEFYFGNHSNVIYLYKMTGISFQSGDTYSFQVSADLTCL